MKLLIVCMFVCVNLFAQQKKDLLDLLDKIDSAYTQTSDSLNDVLELHQLDRLHLFTKWRLMIAKQYVSSLGAGKLYVYVRKSDEWVSLGSLHQDWFADKDTLIVKVIRYHFMWKGDDWRVLPPELPPEIGEKDYEP